MVPSIFQFILLVVGLSGMVSCSSKSSSEKGNTFYISFNSEPTTLNPINSSDAYATRVQQFVVDRLLTKDPNTNEYMPGLAESWTVSPDGKVYTFKIRQGVKFSDGTELKAKDVKFSFDAVLDTKYEAAHKLAYFQNINSPKVIDDYNIEFTVKNKYFGNLETLAMGILVVPEAVYSKQSKDNKLSKVLIGSGPYKILQYNKSKNLVLTKNTDWWGFKTDQSNLKDIYGFDKIFIRFVKEDAIRLELLKKQKLTYSTISGEEFVKKIDTSKSEWSHLNKHEVENDAYKGYSFIGWNLKNPIFVDKKVRVALSHLMNRELLREKFQFGKSYLAAGPLYSQSPYADKSVLPIPFDVDKAKKLLTEAGWSDTDQDGILDKKIAGKKVDFKFGLLNPNREIEKYFTVYKEDLKKAGIELDIKNVDWNSFIKALNERKFDAVTLAWSSTEDDVDVDYKQIWHSESADANGSNFIGYSNPVVDKLIDESRAELDRAKRIPILQKVFRIIAEDSPYLFMFTPKVMYVVDKNINVKQTTYKFTVGTAYWSVKKPESN
jgi:ABC-type transport system substrate-binding protein